MPQCNGYYKLVVINQYGKKQIYQYDLDNQTFFIGEKILKFMNKDNSNMCVIYKIKKNQSVDLDITKFL